MKTPAPEQERLGGSGHSSKTGCAVPLAILGWIFVLLQGWVLVQVQAEGAHEYEFEGKQLQRESVRLEVVLHADRDSIVAAAREVGVASPEAVQAFASIPASGDGCTIHLLDPDSNPWAPDTAGHELSHCIWGNFHRSRDHPKD